MEYSEASDAFLLLRTCRPRSDGDHETMLLTAIASLAAPLGDLERLRPLTRRAALLGLGASIATSGSQRPAFALELDPDYPGTAVERMQAVRQRAASLTPSELSRDWSTYVRPRLLWAAGMRDLRDATPGQGYTGHAFNDAIHVDATAMRDEESDALNDGRVRGIALGNRLGPGIAAASLTELGPGGSWSTCQAPSSPLSSPRPAEDSGVAHLQVTPPPHRRTAHRRTAAPPHCRTCRSAHLPLCPLPTAPRRLQFRSRIAFKLVWGPDDYSRFLLVDDDGRLLATGAPTGRLPALEERQANYAMVAGSKYGSEAAQMARKEV